MADGVAAYSSEILDLSIGNAESQAALIEANRGAKGGGQDKADTASGDVSSGSEVPSKQDGSSPPVEGQVAPVNLASTTGDPMDSSPLSCDTSAPDATAVRKPRVSPVASATKTTTSQDDAKTTAVPKPQSTAPVQDSKPTPAAETPAAAPDNDSKPVSTPEGTAATFEQDAKPASVPESAISAGKEFSKDHSLATPSAPSHLDKPSLTPAVTQGIVDVDVAPVSQSNTPVVTEVKSAPSPDASAPLTVEPNVTPAPPSVTPCVDDHSSSQTSVTPVSSDQGSSQTPVDQVPGDHKSSPAGSCVNEAKGMSDTTAATDVDLSAKSIPASDRDSAAHVLVTPAQSDERSPEVTVAVPPSLPSETPGNSDGAAALAPVASGKDSPSMVPASGLGDVPRDVQQSSAVGTSGEGDVNLTQSSALAPVAIPASVTPTAGSEEVPKTEAPIEVIPPVAKVVGGPQATVEPVAHEDSSKSAGSVAVEISSETSITESSVMSTNDADSSRVPAEVAGEDHSQQVVTDPSLPAVAAEAATAGSEGSAQTPAVVTASAEYSDKNIVDVTPVTSNDDSSEAPVSAHVESDSSGNAPSQVTPITASEDLTSVSVTPITHGEDSLKVTTDSTNNLVTPGKPRSECPVTAASVPEIPCDKPLSTGNDVDRKAVSVLPSSRSEPEVFDSVVPVSSADITPSPASLTVITQASDSGQAPSVVTVTSELTSSGVPLTQESTETSVSPSNKVESEFAPPLATSGTNRTQGDGTPQPACHAPFVAPSTESARTAPPQTDDVSLPAVAGAEDKEVVAAPAASTGEPIPADSSTQDHSQTESTPKDPSTAKSALEATSPSLPDDMTDLKGAIDEKTTVPSKPEVMAQKSDNPSVPKESGSDLPAADVTKSEVATVSGSSAPKVSAVSEPSASSGLSAPAEAAILKTDIQKQAGQVQTADDQLATADDASEKKLTEKSVTSSEPVSEPKIDDIVSEKKTEGPVVLAKPEKSEADQQKVKVDDKTEKKPTEQVSPPTKTNTVGPTEEKPPGSEAKKSSPLSESSKSSPASEASKTSPSSEASKTSPSSEASKTSPGSEGSKTSPGTEANKTSPGSEASRAQPPTFGSPMRAKAKAGHLGRSGKSGKKLADVISKLMPNPSASQSGTGSPLGVASLFDRPGSLQTDKKPSAVPANSTTEKPSSEPANVAKERKTVLDEAPPKPVTATQTGATKASYVVPLDESSLRENVIREAEMAKKAPVGTSAEPAVGADTSSQKQSNIGPVKDTSAQQSVIRGPISARKKEAAVVEVQPKPAVEELPAVEKPDEAQDVTAPAELPASKETRHGVTPVDSGLVVPKEVISPKATVAEDSEKVDEPKPASTEPSVEAEAQKPPAAKLTRAQRRSMSQAEEAVPAEKPKKAADEKPTRGGRTRGAASKTRGAVATAAATADKTAETEVKPAVRKRGQSGVAAPTPETTTPETTQEVLVSTDEQAKAEAVKLDATVPEPKLDAPTAVADVQKQDTVNIADIEKELNVTADISGQDSTENQAPDASSASQDVPKTDVDAPKKTDGESPAASAKATGRGAGKRGSPDGPVIATRRSKRIRTVEVGTQKKEEKEKEKSKGAFSAVMDLAPPCAAGDSPMAAIVSEVAKSSPCTNGQGAFSEVSSVSKLIHEDASLDVDDPNSRASVTCDSLSKASKLKSGENSQDPMTYSPATRTSKKHIMQLLGISGAAPDPHEGVSAQCLAEYRWPQDKSGDYYMLQEQVSEFLGITSFKRKYPDLARRPIGVEERNYLREINVVSEIQCDLGLTALSAAEVCDILARDFPDKYKSYTKVLAEREQQKIREKHREYEQLQVDKDKLKTFVQKAVKAAAEYNFHLNRERREERRAYFDLQTQEVHYPGNTRKILPKEMTKVGAYPVALIPGQFQDYYKEYTSQQLKYFPIKTALYDPPKSLKTIYADPDAAGTEGDTEGSTADTEGTGSDSSSSDSGSDSDSDSEDEPLAKMIPDETSNQSAATPTPTPAPTPTPTPTPTGRGTRTPVSRRATPKAKIIKEDSLPATPKEPAMAKDPPPMCNICQGGPDKNAIGENEELVRCAECGRFGHPSCLELTTEMIPIIKTYPWQCMECKTCVECMDPYDEDKMMFCDHCDRGYHSFCVGLKNIPTGRWECKSCKNVEPPKAKRVKTR